MARPRAYMNNAIAQLFDEIEEKCHVRFATFTASESQGQINKNTQYREYMSDVRNNDSNGIYKYLYDPNLSFDFRFHQRLAAAPFRKSSTPWVTIMFNTKQPRPLTNILSHKYKDIKYDPNGRPHLLKVKRVSVPVNMALISNDIDKLYETTEKISTYFDRFINFHYDHVITVGDLKKDGFNIYESKVGQAANMREIDLTKLDTEQRGSLVSEAYQFDLVYWVVEDPEVELNVIKRIILDFYVSDEFIGEFVILDRTNESEDDNKEDNEDGGDEEDNTHHCSCDCGC